MSEETTFATALADIFNDLGIDITYNSSTIKGIFIETSVEIDSGSGIAESTGPTLEVIRTDAPDIDHNDTVTINGSSYKVTGITYQRRYTKHLELVKI